MIWAAFAMCLLTASFSYWLYRSATDKAIVESCRAQSRAEGFTMQHVTMRLTNEVEPRLAKLEAPPVKATRKPRAKRINEAEASDGVVS